METKCNLLAAMTFFASILSLTTTTEPSTRHSMTIRPGAKVRFQSRQRQYGSTLLYVQCTTFFVFVTFSSSGENDTTIVAVAAGQRSSSMHHYANMNLLEDYLMSTIAVTRRPSSNLERCVSRRASGHSIGSSFRSFARKIGKGETPVAHPARLQF